MSFTFHEATGDLIGAESVEEIRETLEDVPDCNRECCDRPGLQYYGDDVYYCSSWCEFIDN